MMHWFKHDTGANQDAKMQNVLLDYGLEGYGLYWYCIELIAGKVCSENITFQLEHDARILARNTGSSVQRVEEMMKYFVKIGLFELSDNTITCLKLAKRLDKSMTSNPQMREIIGNLKNHDGITINSDSVMQDKIRLDKNREDKNREEIKCGDKSPVPLQSILDAYHEHLPSMAAVQIYTDKRKSKVRTFFNKRKAEYKKKGIDYNIDMLVAYFKYIASNCKWMLEDRPNGNGGFWKAKNFDYVMTEDCYVAVKEQRHDDLGGKK